jgi:hypothetical protein
MGAARFTSSRLITQLQQINLQSILLSLVYNILLRLSTINFLVVLCTALLASAAATLRLDKTSNLPSCCLVEDSFDIHPIITTF